MTNETSTDLHEYGHELEILENLPDTIRHASAIPIIVEKNVKYGATLGY